ncbi:MAG TPA: hypothetical protein VFX78_08720 [Candidatus Eisenbacteria bacterium]|nr:hypothetical protein [Candidatus Eisenbacteria bacterium]
MIDTSLDLRSDGAGDADTYSPTMRRHHRLLWSMPLPGGAMFDLEEAGTLCDAAFAPRDLPVIHEPAGGRRK